MGFLWPDNDDYPNEEEWERIRKRFNCWHWWPDGVDPTEAGCANCGYKRMKEIAPDSPEGQEVLRQFLQTKYEDYVHLVEGVPFDSEDGDE